METFYTYFIDGVRGLENQISQLLRVCTDVRIIFLCSKINDGQYKVAISAGITCEFNCGRLKCKVSRELRNY